MTYSWAGLNFILLNETKMMHLEICCEF